MSGLRRTTTAAAAALLLVASFSLSDGHASPIPPTPELWIVAADGSGERVLVERGTQFDWAPDGDRLAVSGPLAVVDASSGDETVLTEAFEGASEPRWSPDGSTIAYLYCEDGGCGIAEISPDGSGNRVLMEAGDESPPAGMSWSPDSRLLAFIEGRGGGRPGHLFVLDVQMGIERQVSSTPAFYSETTWSPDNEWISFMEWDEDASYGLNLVRPDGSGEVSVSGGLDYVAGPEWSPTGDEIAFTGTEQEGSTRLGVYLASPSETAPRLFVENAVDPSWSRDGDEISYSLRGDLFARPRDEGAARALTSEDLRDDRGPDWSPDGDEIVYVGTRVQVLCGGLPYYPLEASTVGTNGDDVLIGTPGRDVIAGRGGNDVIHGLGGDDVICGDGGFDEIDGGEGKDVLYGNSGRDEIAGGPGDDSLEGSHGQDLLAGGEGTDLVTYLSSDSAVDVDLRLGRAQGEGADRLIDVENVTGSRQPDVLAGDGGPNLLEGTASFWSRARDHDTLIGRGGGDYLRGFSGADRLRGGAGRDTLSGGEGMDDCDGGPGRDSLQACE